MRNQSHFTTCNICSKSISSGEQHLSLNFHRETGNRVNGQKTITVHFAKSAIITCIDCGKHLSEFALSRDLVDHFRNRVHNMVPPTPSKEKRRTKVDLPSPLPSAVVHRDDISGSDTGMTINEVDGITPVPALDKMQRRIAECQRQVQRSLNLAKSLNLSSAQIRILKTYGPIDMSVILSLLERKDCSHNFEQAVAAIENMLW